MKAMRPPNPRQKQPSSKNKKQQKKFTVKNCKEDAPPLSATSTACIIPGVQPSSSAVELKAAADPNLPCAAIAKLSEGTYMMGDESLPWQRKIFRSKFVKTEQEKLEKLARKGSTPEEKLVASSGVSVSDVKPSASSPGASTAKVSIDKYWKYAVVASVMTATTSLGWYLKASGKKEEVQD
ncbi:hypothetical protein ACFX12_013507 [Malus domestica]